MKGLHIFTNPLGMTCFQLHYSADPEKDPENADRDKAESALEWLTSARQSYPDPNDWAREMECNFFVGKGVRVFPQFLQALHCQPLQFNKRKVVYRSWDFGWHCPVCIIAQVDGKERLLILHEIVGSKQTTRDFASMVIAKCGELFPLHTPGYEDYCDPAGQQVKSIESEKSERRDIEVLNGLGIFPRYEYGWSRKDGRTLLHQLLALRTDKTPGMYVDMAHAPLLTQAFLGQYIYPERKVDGKVDDEPNDDEHPWGDVMAAMRYLVTGLHSSLGLRRFLPMIPPPTTHTSALDYHGYGTPHKKVTHARDSA